MASREWPATAELRRLLEGLLDDAPAGMERVVLAQALGLLRTHELVPSALAPAPSSLHLPTEPKGTHP